MHSFVRRGVTIAAVCCALTVPAGTSALPDETPAKALFEDARALEVTLRKELATYRSGSSSLPLVRRARILIGTYEDIARLFPDGGYGDKSLWQGASLAADAFDLFKDSTDRETALRLGELLLSRYKTSPLVAQARRRINALAPSATTATAKLPSPPVTAPAAVPQVPLPVELQPAPVRSVARTSPVSVTTLEAIKREVLPDVVRVSLELDHEAVFHDERLDGPSRVFVDLQNTRAGSEVQDARLSFDDDVVRQIRVGRQLDKRTRVVMDLEGAPPHAVYALYNPFRIVIDFERRRTTGAPATEPARAAKPAETPEAQPPVANILKTADAPTMPGPAVKLPNGLSISRQLGLGLERVVIDPGHGGHDPGAKQGDILESELVLDVALRLEQLLQKEGIEVVLTRRSNVFVPLEERPAIALREQADVYLSIHANASSDRRVRGVETYVLDFAANAQSAELAARENRGSAKTMNSLTDIVRTIALKNKIEESRDLARQVQGSLIEKLSKGNRTVRNLGVKQAPFAVLVGTDMPSILAEIGFITNKQDAALARTAVYRQQIAEALANGILRYQKRLKPVQVAQSK